MLNLFNAHNLMPEEGGMEEWKDRKIRRRFFTPLRSVQNDIRAF
jgi:hypothetical protein